MELDLTSRLFDLISENESFDDLLNELSGGTNLYQLDALSNPTFIGLQSLVENQSKLTGSSISIASANILCSVIQSSFARSEQKLYLDSAEERAKLDILINVGKHFISKNQFSSRVFAKNLNRKDGTFVPFEVVWMLHKSSLMTLDLFFLCNLDHPSVINDLSSHLGSICCKDEGHDNDLRRSMLYDVIVCLLKTAFIDNVGNVISRGLKKVSQALLDNILKKLLSLKDRDHDVNMFELLNSKYGTEEGIDKEVMEKYYLRQVIIILTKKVDEGFSLDLFSSHQKWTFAKMNKNLRNVFEELLVPLSVDEIFSALKKLLEQKEFDWRTGMMFLSVMLVCFPSFVNHLEGLAMDMLQRSLQSQSFEDLVTSLLLIRHCCVQGVHIYMPYSAWFKKSFKDEGGVQMTKKSFSFFIKSLSSIMPHESECFIKAHIQNSPSASQKSREEWLDYVTLAKTHLSDIRSDVDDVAVELEQQEMINRTEKEIELAMESFRKDRKVPSFIIEMSLFARPHFIGKFLPVLLKPRLLPGIPDERMLLITALHESQKIPATMFQKYESECRQMTLDLVKGVIELDGDDDDDEMQVLQLPLLDQLKASVNNLQSSILSQNDKNFNKYLNDTSEKLGAILKKLSPNMNTNDDSSIIDLADEPIVGGELCKASHTILEFILRTTFLEIQQTRLLNSDWLGKIILMLSNHKDILAHVYRIALNLIANKSNHLSACHFIGLANIVSQRIHADKEIFGNVTSSDRSFIDLVEEATKFKDVGRLRQMTSFVCSYVALVRDKFGELVTPKEDSRRLGNGGDCGEDDGGDGGGDRGENDGGDDGGSKGIVPKEFVDILLFALPKLHPQLRSRDDDDDVKKFIENYDSDNCIKLVMVMIYVEKIEPFNRRPTFKNWLDYEMNCIDADQNFSIFNDYSMWAVNSGRYVLPERDYGDRSRLERYCLETFEYLCRCDAMMISGACFDCRKDFRQRGEEKYLRFVYLLQTISNRISINHNCSPWLWEGINRVINHSDSNPSSQSLISKKIIGLVTLLPPHLLISNSSIISETPAETITKGLNELILFVNNSLRNIASDYFLTIDFNLTLHIVQSLSSINSLNLMDLFNRSPLFTFSVFHHWESLKSVEYRKESCSLNIIFNQIDQIINSHASNRTTNSLRSSAALFLGLQQDSIKVFKFCVEMASSIYCAVYKDKKKSSFASVSSKLESRPDLFVQIYKLTNSGRIGELLRSTLPDFVHSLWASAVLSAFVHSSKNKEFCSSSSSDVNFLNSLLECYKNFNEFFDSRDIDHSTLCSEPFASLGEASQALVNYLNNVPPHCFKDIDEEVLNSSDVLIRSLINKR